MKKTVLLLSVILLLAALFACGEPSKQSETGSSTGTSSGTSKVTDKSTDKVTDKTTNKVTNNDPPVVTSPPEPDYDIITPENSIISYISGYHSVFNLTEHGSKYWEFYGPLDGESDVEQNKANSADIITTTFNHEQSHYDNKAVVSWTDGASVEAAFTTNGRNSHNEITVKVKTSGCSEIKFLVGAWKATNKMTVIDASGAILGTYDLLTAGNDAFMALATVDLTKYSGDEITVLFTATDKDGGNVSLTAVTVK